mmetsp:Transcript_20794/g.35017  ORF Transcript_20794/g.35017 Transcript_20794/m.35017 type:complete len:473 (+) Transcript_20794:97-1515(+)
MTYCSNWGFSDIEVPGRACSSSFNDQDEPSHTFSIEIVPNVNILNQACNKNCYILTITSDYTTTSVSSVIHLLWERNQILCYSLAAALQGDPTRSRQVVAFTPHFKYQNRISSIVHDVLGLTVKVDKLTSSAFEDDDFVSDDDDNDASSSLVMHNVISRMEHDRFVLIQLALSTLVLHQSWHAFSEDGEAYYHTTYGGGVGAVARICIDENTTTSAGREGVAPLLCDIENDKKSFDMKGKQGYLDSCRISSLTIDHSTGIAVLTVAVRAFRYSPVQWDEVTAGAKLTCVCSGEELTVLAPGVEVHYQFPAKTSSSKDQFLSAFDVANRLRGYSSYLPASLESFLDHYWYCYGVKLTETEPQLHDCETQNIKQDHASRTGIADRYDEEEEEDSFFLDMGLSTPANDDVRQPKRTSIKRSSCEYRSGSGVFATARVLSTSGPMVYPLMLLTSRFVQCWRIIILLYGLHDNFLLT